MELKQVSAVRCARTRSTMLIKSAKHGLRPAPGRAWAFEPRPATKKVQKTPFVLKCMNMRVKLINLKRTLKTDQIRWLFPVLSPLVPCGHLINHDRAFSWLAFAIFSELTICYYLSKDQQIKIDTIIAIYCLLFLLLDLFWAFLAR